MKMDEIKAHVIKARQDGKTYDQIAVELNKLGAKTPSGSEWGSSNVNLFAVRNGWVSAGRIQPGGYVTKVTRSYKRKVKPTLEKPNEFLNRLGDVMTSNLGEATKRDLVLLLAEKHKGGA